MPRTLRTAPPAEVSKQREFARIALRSFVYTAQRYRGTEEKTTGSVERQVVQLHLEERDRPLPRPIRHGVKSLERERSTPDVGIAEPNVVLLQSRGVKDGISVLVE